MRLLALVTAWLLAVPRPVAAQRLADLAPAGPAAGAAAALQPVYLPGAASVAPFAPAGAAPRAVRAGELFGGTLGIASLAALGGLVAGRQADHRRCVEDHPNRASFIFRQCSTDFHRSASDGWYAGATAGAASGGFVLASRLGACPERSAASRLVRAVGGAALGTAPGLAVRAIGRGRQHETEFVASLETPLLQGFVVAKLLTSCPAGRR
jgi:hypothetical protein